MDKLEQQKNNIRKKIEDLIDEYSKLKFTKNKFIKGVSSVPVSGKVIGSSEIKNMVNASLDGWLTTGRFNKLFQIKLSKFLGVKHVLTVNSGSSANLIAFNTLTSEKLGDKRIKKNDEVITVAAGFPTTINPIIQFGAIPVFVDVEMQSYNISSEKIENAITSKTKAIMLAHTLGNPFNLKKIIKLCKKYNLWLIEDCCDALGSKYNNKLVGTFGDIATLSFYPAHHITMGEGGAVFTNNLKLKIIAESFRDWGRDCFCEPGKDNTCKRRFLWTKKDLGGDLPDGYDHKYTYSHLGYNLKITDMQASCALAQLERLEYFINKRKENFLFLYNQFKKLKKYFILPKASKLSDPSWFGFPITIRKNKFFTRDEIISYLNKRNIGTRLLFAGNVTKQPYMKKNKYKISGKLKNTDLIMKNTFWLGVFPGLEKKHLQYVIEEISNFINLKKN